MNSSKAQATAGRRRLFAAAASRAGTEAELAPEFLEVESAHRRAFQDRQMELHYAAIKRGQCFNFISGILAIICAAVVAFFGHTWPAAGIAVGGGITTAAASLGMRRLESIS